MIDSLERVALELAYMRRFDADRSKPLEKAERCLAAMNEIRLAA